MLIHLRKQKPSSIYQPDVEPTKAKMAHPYIQFILCVTFALFICTILDKSLSHYCPEIALLPRRVQQPATGLRELYPKRHTQALHARMGALPKMAIHSEGVVVQVTAGPLSACATSVRCYQSHMFRMEGHRRHFQQPKGQSQTKRLALRHRRAGEENPTSASSTRQC